MNRHVAFRSWDGQYLSARTDEPNTPIRATRPDIGPWEIFEEVEVDADHLPQPPAPAPAAAQPAVGLWAGITDFRLAQRMMAGEDIRPIIQQRLDVGATLLRVLAMKTNNTASATNPGWDLIPRGRADYWGDVRRFFDTIVLFPGLMVEWTVFADTKLVMPNQGEQLAFWDKTTLLLNPYRELVNVELCNEWNHPTQQIDPRAFPRTDRITCSHGSGLTDADTVQPRWDYAAYHARRDGAKGFTNYDPYEFQSVYPQPCPLIPDEGAKPEDYRFDDQYAWLMGRHAACGWGGTFHWAGGIDSRLMTPDEERCARRFFQGLRA